MFRLKYRLQEEEGGEEGGGGGEGSDGILDAGSKGGEGGQDADKGGQGGEGKEWFLSEGVKGEGEPPEWFKADKYKSVADQAKAYPELAKKLGSFTGAPEAYELTMPEGVEIPEGIDWQPDPEHPLAKKVMEIGKEIGLSQEGFERLYGAFVESELSMVPNPAEVMKAIDENEARRTQRIDHVTDFLRANLDESSYAEAKAAIGYNPEVFKLVEKLVGLQKDVSLKDTQTGDGDKTALKEQYFNMQNEKDDKGQRRLDVDPAFRKKWRELGAKVFGTGPASEVVGRQ